MNNLHVQIATIHMENRTLRRSIGHLTTTLDAFVSSYYTGLPWFMSRRSDRFLPHRLDWPEPGLPVPIYIIDIVGDVVSYYLRINKVIDISQNDEGRIMRTSITKFLSKFTCADYSGIERTGHDM